MITLALLEVPEMQYATFSGTPMRLRYPGIILGVSQSG
jgi:hypothetical protein